MFFTQDGELKIGRVIAVVFVVLVGLALVFGSVGTVGAGERGIRLRFSAVVGDIDEGLYFKLPFIEKVKIIDVKIQKEEVAASAASADLQTVSSTVALNFHPQPEKAAQIYQSVGMDYKSRLIDPAIQEAVKASTAKFTAEELITKRESVREEIKKHLVEKLSPSGISVDGFNIVNFDFSAQFNKAIESKVTAEQDALAAKNKLEQVKFEAEQKIAEAKGKAEAIRIESNALQSNPAILQLRALEKWNGIMPQVTGSAMPFINLK